MDGWDIALLTAAAYVAVTGLVRLMRQRRDELSVTNRGQVEAQKRRLQSEERRAKEKSRREKRKAA